MVLTPLDWLIVAGFLLLPVAVAVAVAGRARENLRQYFLAGGDLPWGSRGRRWPPPRSPPTRPWR